MQNKPKKHRFEQNETKQKRIRRKMAEACQTNQSSAERRKTKRNRNESDEIGRKRAKPTETAPIRAKQIKTETTKEGGSVPNKPKQRRAERGQEPMAKVKGQWSGVMAKSHCQISRSYYNQIAYQDSRYRVWSGWGRSMGDLGICWG